MPNICFGTNITVSCVIFVTSSHAQFLTNFSFNTTVHCSLLSNIFTITRPEISSTNGASIFMNFLSLGLTITCSFEKNGKDLFKKLNEESHMSITPSNSNTFFIPSTKSALSCISDTNVNTLNLCPWMSTIAVITSSTATYYPLPT